jgi:rRNA maturation endonuclease Nob1
MGIFNRLGREVEQFKQTAKQSAQERQDYRCVDCDARFSTDHDYCPDCGEDAIVETVDEDE